MRPSCAHTSSAGDESQYGMTCKGATHSCNCFRDAGRTHDFCASRAPRYFLKTLPKLCLELGRRMLARCALETRSACRASRYCGSWKRMRIIRAPGDRRLISASSPIKQSLNWYSVMAPHCRRKTGPVSHNHPLRTGGVFHRVLTVTLREFSACCFLGRRAAVLWSPSSRRDFDARNIGNGSP
jgi:hypothetical protein